jgi:hypothetical protein
VLPGCFQQGWPEAIDCDQRHVQEDRFKEVESASNGEEDGARNAKA